MSTGASRIGVGIEIRQGKGGKKQKNRTATMPEQKNITNYDILLKMGFKDESIRENKVLGLKETTRIQLDNYLLEDAMDQQDENVIIDRSGMREVGMNS